MRSGCALSSPSRFVSSVQLYNIHIKNVSMKAFSCVVWPKKGQKFPLNEPTERRKKTQISLSLTLSFEEDEEKKETNRRGGVLPVARLCTRLSLSRFRHRERENYVYDERKKTNKISPQRNKGKEEISLSHPKEEEEEYMNVWIYAHLNGSCSVGVMTKPFSEDILFSLYVVLSLSVCEYGNVRSRVLSLSQWGFFFP